MCNKHGCTRPDTHLIFGWGTCCALHARKVDREFLFELGLDPVLDALLLSLSLQVANADGWDEHGLIYHEYLPQYDY